jgi:folate-binding protein YgfZ
MYSGEFLQDRSIITLSGKEVKEFLQGLVTNDMSKIEQKKTIYALMLTPQGKFLYDFYIWENLDKIYIDCLLADRDQIIDKLNLYRLGQDIKVRASSYYSVLFVSSALPGFSDPRIPNRASRVYLSDDEKDSFIKEHDILLNIGEYKRFLCDHAIPDASHDMIKEKSFPLEYGMDEYNAISFAKGCYVGQELVARTKFRGTIRKKIFQITSLKHIHAVKGEEVICNEKSIGIFCSAYKDTGKVLLRHDYLAEFSSQEQKIDAKIGNLEVFIVI